MPADILGCPCCIDAKQVGRLVTTSLRKLGPNDLTSYASQALLTVGNVPDYLYFLPRILELSAHDELWWLDIEITARAICSTDLKSWPMPRREAFVAFLHAVIADAIASDKYFLLDSWLCAIARMELDVRPFLAQVELNSAAVLEYFEHNAKWLRKGELCNPFWELPNAGHDVIVQWFKSDAIRQIPFDGYGYLM